MVVVLREYWLFPWRAVPVVLRLVLKTYETLLLKKGIPGFLLLVLALVIFWHIYVPFHELFHVFGCWLTGGEVEELALKPQYGGKLLQPLFPFIVADSDYAGQLTGFTTPNDLSYFVVDMFPYLLSLPGVALFVYAGKKLAPVIFSLAVVLGLTPIFSIPGDFYEAASLGVGRVASWFDDRLTPRTLLSDDIFSLIPELSEAGLLNAGTLFFFTVGVIGAVYLCLLCMVSQLHLAVKIFGLETIVAAGSTPAKASPAVQVANPQLES